MKREYGHVMDPEYELRYPRVYCTFARKEEAELAYQLAEKFGVVAAMPDGEDSAGRQKLALLPPEQVVQRSCDIARLLVEEAFARDWYFEIPAPEKTEKNR